MCRGNGILYFFNSLSCLLKIIINDASSLQQEARLERQEERLDAKAVNTALHGNIGKAVTLEVGEKNRS